MSELTKRQSGGVNIAGNTTVSGDLVGRDKVTFVFQLQQFVQEFGDAIPIKDPTVTSWFDQMIGAIVEVAQCEVEHSVLTRQISFRIKVWTTELSLLPAQMETGVLTSGSELVLYDALGRDTDWYADQVAALIPRYHQGWERFFVCQSRVLQEWISRVQNPQMESMRHCIAGLLDSIKERKKSQEQARAADIELLQKMLTSTRAEIELHALRKLVAQHNSLINELERGFAYLLNSLHNLDAACVHD